MVTTMLMMMMMMMMMILNTWHVYVEGHTPDGRLRSYYGLRMMVMRMRMMTSMKTLSKMIMTVTKVEVLWR